MLTLNPSERFDIMSVLSHEWMQGEMYGKDEVKASMALRHYNMKET